MAHKQITKFLQHIKYIYLGLSDKNSHHFDLYTNSTSSNYLLFLFQSDSLKKSGD